MALSQVIYSPADDYTVYNERVICPGFKLLYRIKHKTLLKYSKGKDTCIKCDKIFKKRNPSLGKRFNPYSKQANKWGFSSLDLDI